jgi:hypothetical protein
MLKLRFLSLFFATLTPLIFNSLSPSAIAQTPPSRGVAGTVSGNNPTGGSQTPISVPIQLGGITPLATGITISNGGVVTLSPGLQASLNGLGRGIIATFSTGTISQVQIATLLAAAPSISRSLSGKVEGDVTVTIDGVTTTFDTLGGAQALLSSVLSTNPNAPFTLTAGKVTVKVQ